MRMIDINTIKGRSTKATCGVFERQVVVKSENVSKIKKILSASGFMIVGQGPGLSPKTKVVWYNPRGVNI